MLRWLILIVTFAVWLACMRLIYINFAPRESDQIIHESEGALNNFFDEDVEPHSFWLIYVDPEVLKNNKLIPAGLIEQPKENPDAKPGQPHEGWNGYDEHDLLQVGEIEITIKQHRTQAEEIKHMSLRFPAQIKSVLQQLGEMTYDSRAGLSLDHGLESFTSTFRIKGIALEGTAIGSRDGNVLNVTRDIKKDDRQIMRQSDRITVTNRAAPNVGVMPFQRHKNIQEKAEWEIPMVDTSTIDMKGTAEPKYIGIKVTCTGRVKIFARDGELTAFAVHSADDKARAWYSADGVVLKQEFNFLDVLPVIVVRNDARLVPNRKR